jgi:hypothetical protein
MDLSRLREEIRDPQPGPLVRPPYGGAVHGGERAAGLGLLGSAPGSGGYLRPLWLKERIESPRLRKVVLYGRTDWVHHVRVVSIDDLDDEVTGWLCRSYQVGCGQLS